MKKVYIDISSLSDLKCNNYMLDLICKSKSYGFTYYYSPAHLFDLDAAGAKENKPELREEELKYIENIVDANYIFYDKAKNELLKYNTPPTRYIQECFKSGTASNKLNNIMKSDLDVDEINEEFKGKLNYEVSKVRKYLEAMTDDNLYKKCKRELMENCIMSEEDLKEFIRNVYCQYPNDLDKIISFTYDYVDFLDGIKDKLKLVDRPKNTNADALHCFCATYCDYFITSDKTLFSKSKFVYSFLNDLGIIRKIKTKVYTLDKFIEEIKNNLN